MPNTVELLLLFYVLLLINVVPLSFLRSQERLHRYRMLMCSVLYCTGTCTCTCTRTRYARRTRLRTFTASCCAFEGVSTT
jgi:hypothetical protein